MCYFCIDTEMCYLPPISRIQVATDYARGSRYIGNGVAVITLARVPDVLKNKTLSKGDLQ